MNITQNKYLSLFVIIIMAILFSSLVFFSGLSDSISQDFILESSIPTKQFTIIVFSLITFITLLLASKKNIIFQTKSFIFLILISFLGLFFDFAHNRPPNNLSAAYGIFVGICMHSSIMLRSNLRNIVSLFLIILSLSVLIVGANIINLPLISYSSNFLAEKPVLGFFVSNDGIALNNNTLSAVSVSSLALLLSLKNQMVSSRDILLDPSFFIFIMSAIVSRNATMILYYTFIFLLVLAPSAIRFIKQIKISAYGLLLFSVITFSLLLSFSTLLIKIQSSGVLKYTLIFLNLSIMSFAEILFGSSTYIYSESSFIDLISKIGLPFTLTISTYFGLLSTMNQKKRDGRLYIYFASYLYLLLSQNSVFSPLPAIYLGFIIASFYNPLESSLVKYPE